MLLQIADISPLAQIIALTSKYMSYIIQRGNGPYPQLLISYLMASTIWNLVRFTNDRIERNNDVLPLSLMTHYGIPGKPYLHDCLYQATNYFHSKWFII